MQTVIWVWYRSEQLTILSISLTLIFENLIFPEKCKNSIYNLTEICPAKSGMAYVISDSMRAWKMMLMASTDRPWYLSRDRRNSRWFHCEIKWLFCCDSVAEKWTPRILAQLTRSFSGSRGDWFFWAGGGGGKQFPWFLPAWHIRKRGTCYGNVAGWLSVTCRYCIKTARHLKTYSTIW